MREAASIGILPHLYGKYTLRSLFAAFRGAAIAHARQRQVEILGAYMTARYSGLRKLPNLSEEIRKWEVERRVRKMTPEDLRRQIIMAAQLSGANIIKTKR